MSDKANGSAAPAAAEPAAAPSTTGAAPPEQPAAAPAADTSSTPVPSAPATDATIDQDLIAALDQAGPSAEEPLPALPPDADALLKVGGGNVSRGLEMLAMLAELLVYLSQRPGLCCHVTPGGVQVGTAHGSNGRDAVMLWTPTLLMMPVVCLTVQEFYKDVKDVDRDNEVKRIISAFRLNPFEQLGLRYDATEEDIRRQYRKLSLLVHPDKCRHPQAKAAFEIVNSASKQLQNEEYRKELLHTLNLARGERSRFQGCALCFCENARRVRRQTIWRRLTILH